jgi:hypothetical protein
VRQRQEVQELPRRVNGARPARPAAQLRDGGQLADGSSCREMGSNGEPIPRLLGAVASGAATSKGDQGEVAMGTAPIAWQRMKCGPVNGSGSRPLATRNGARRDAGRSIVPGTDRRYSGERCLARCFRPSCRHVRSGRDSRSAA